LIERIKNCFLDLQEEQRAALVTFTMMGDPDIERSFEILKGLPNAGADIIEIGTPFTDPMADGPVIQAAGQRALKAGITLTKTLELVQRFRKIHKNTPVVLMGYFNPIYIYGVNKFIEDAKSAGIDGVIIVDLPAEEDPEFCVPAIENGLAFVRLVAPTTDVTRLPFILKNSAGFVYYISITGITGSNVAMSSKIAESVHTIRGHTNLPICVGFGVKTPQQASEIAKFADGVVVGSALVDCIAKSLVENSSDSLECVESVHQLVKSLSIAIRAAISKEPLK
tara:strand:- start:2057 stop:2899 length:843 start_codon:yes stop_codon:yes gene_type:complete